MALLAAVGGASNMSLPQMRTPNKDLTILQTTWASQLDPLLAKPLSQAILLQNIEINIGNNTINHKLGRNLQGWVVSRVFDAVIGLYEIPSQLPSKTLILNANAAGTIDLLVF